MSFGWSAGDIANAITLIVKLAQALDDAEGSACDYRKAVSFLRDLTHTLEPLVNFPAWDAYPTYGQSIAKHIKHIKEPVKTFLEAVIKYEPSLGLGAAGGRHRNVLRKVQWYLFMNKKVLKLRDSIDSHMSIIDSELKHLTLDVVYKIEHKLPDNVRAIVREALPPDLMTLLRDHLSTIDARMLNQIDAVQTRGHERVFSSLEGQYQKLFVNIDSLRQQLKVTNITQERIELCLRRGGAQKLVKDGSASAADEAPGIDQTTGQDGSCDIVLDSDRRTAGALQEIYYMVLVYLGHFLQNLFLVLSRLVQPSAALTFQYDARYNISFLDAIGRAPRILPFEFFRSFKMMQDFIECEFSNLPGAIWIKKGRYMVSRLSDHQALDVATWARLIVPGSKVEMSIVIRKQLGSGTAGTVAYCPENSCSGSWEMTGEETWATCPDCQKRVLVSVQGKKPTLGIDAKTPLPSKPQGRLAEGTALDARSRNRGRPLFSTPPFDELMFTSPESEGSNIFNWINSTT
ncbi:hypothetical protein IFR05_003508 [Cadophora sp. M221]|nr:hypothetical protein IFR05_003508 [Cadophora sp. M221]